MSKRLLARGTYLLTSELCNYELRRGLILARKTGSLSEGFNKLNELRSVVDFLIITQNIAQVAAEYWADARV